MSESNWLKLVKTREGSVSTSNLGPVGGGLGARIKRSVDNTATGQVTILGFVDLSEVDLLIEALEKAKAEAH